MVTTTLIGRTGNQMFQTAVAIGYARKYEMDYCIPEKSLDPNVWQTYFKFPVKDFEVKKVYKERSHCYVPIPKFQDVRLEGYWQTEKYFEHCKDEVKALFNFNAEMIPGVVSIHVRRGDYLLHPHLFPVLPEIYYQKAITHFKLMQFTKFLVFSDDIQWCKENLNNEKYGVEFEYSEGNSEIQDMELMSRCENNIIANSSFSWWGAWLNQNPNKRVISPSHLKWFGRGNRHLKTNDVIPKEWIQIQF